MKAEWKENLNGNAVDENGMGGWENSIFPFCCLCLYMCTCVFLFVVVVSSLFCSLFLVSCFFLLHCKRECAWWKQNEKEKRKERRGKQKRKEREGTKNVGRKSLTRNSKETFSRNSKNNNRREKNIVSTSNNIYKKKNEICFGKSLLILFRLIFCNCITCIFDLFL